MNASATREPWGLVAVFAVTQNISWGTLYYTPTVLAAHVQAETGWSLPFVLGGFSTGILVSGLAAPLAGRWIDARGGRLVMSAGSLVAVLALVLMAWTTHRAGYYAAWCLAGVAMAGTLYEAAFATLNQHFPINYRRALTSLTLAAGFASTMFWPITYALAGTIGWRASLWLFAALHLVVCLPMHAWLIPRPGEWRERLAAAGAAAPPPSSLPRRRVALLLATAFALNSLVSTGLLAQITRLLGVAGLTGAQAVGMAALLGPMQVVGRVLEFTFARHLTPTRLATLALAALPIALIVALAGDGPVAAVVFVMLLGLSNGVMTIVRGVVPAAIFGRERLATVLGLLAAPGLAARAAAPLLVSMLIAGLATLQHVFGVLAVIAAAAVIAFRMIPTAVRSSPLPVEKPGRPL